MRPSDILNIKVAKATTTLIMLVQFGMEASTYVAGKSALPAPGAISELIKGLAGALFLGLTIIAGFVFRIKLTPYLSGYRLYGFPLRNAILFFLSLGLLESTRYALSGIFDWGIFFKWNYLHLAGLSFLLIALCMKRSIWWLWALTITTLVGNEFVRPYLYGVYSQVNIDHMRDAFRAINFQQLFLIASIIISLVFVIKLFFGHTTKRVKALGFVAILATALFSNHMIQTHFFKSNYAVGHLYTLPLGMLFTPLGSRHIWSVFPWFSSIGWGYLLCEYYLRYKHRTLFNSIVTTVSLTGFCFFLARHGEHYFAQKLDTEVSMTSTIFKPHIIGMIGIISIFNLRFLLNNFFNQLPLVAKVLQHRVSKHLVNVFSEGIFVIYLGYPVIYMSAAEWLEPILPDRFMLIGITFATIVQGYLIAAIARKVLTSKKIFIRLRRS